MENNSRNRNQFQNSQLWNNQRRNIQSQGNQLQGGQYQASQLQYVSTSRDTHIPGLKVSYGSAAVAAGGSASTGSNMFLNIPEAETSQRKGIFSRLRETIINIVTEEAESDRPIGISQLSRQTFCNTTLSDYDLPAGASRPHPFVKTGRELQDYRFNNLVDNRR